MKAQPQPEQQRGETLVERAQRVMCESRQLAKVREAQARKMEQIVNRATQTLTEFIES